MGSTTPLKLQYVQEGKHYLFFLLSLLGSSSQKSSPSSGLHRRGQRERLEFPHSYFPFRAFGDTRDSYQSRSPPFRGCSGAPLPHQAAQTGCWRRPQRSAAPASAGPARRGEALRRNGSFTDAGSPLPSSGGEGGSGRAARGSPLPSARAAAPGGGGARRPAAPLPARCHRRPATAPEPRHFRHGENHFRCAPVCIRGGAGRGGAGSSLPGRGGLAGGHLGFGPRPSVAWLVSPKMAAGVDGGGSVLLLVHLIHVSFTASLAVAAAPSRRRFSSSAASCGGGGEAGFEQPSRSAGLWHALVGRPLPQRPGAALTFSRAARSRAFVLIAQALEERRNLKQFEFDSWLC